MNEGRAIHRRFGERQGSTESVTSTLGRNAIGAMVGLLLSLLTTAGLVGASAATVRFIGLHGDRASLRIDQRPVLLAVGQSAHGVKVLVANRQLAIVRMRDHNYLIEKGRKQPSLLPAEVIIDRSRGMFFVAGRVNGEITRFVIDTGASHVVLSNKEARRLKLRYSTSNRVPIRTASGRDSAYATTLDSVSVGGIVLNEVPALITRGKAPEIGLLGMTFLGQLKISQDTDQMRISQ